MNRTRSLLEIHFATILLGGVGLFAKLITLPAPIIIFGRTFVACVGLFFLARLIRTSLKLAGRRQWITMLALGAASLLQWVFFFKAIQSSTVSLAVVIFTSYPIFISLMEPWLNGERYKASDVVCSLAIMGAVYMAVPDVSWATASGEGAVFAFISGFGHAVNIVLKRKYAVGRLPSLAISFYEHLFANLLLIPFLLLLVPSVRPESLTGKNLILVAVLGLFFSALTRFLVARSLITLNARTVGFVITLEPIYAIVFAGLWLAETPPLVTISSGILIVGAIFVRQLLANKDIRRVDAAIALELRRLRKNTRCSSPLANAVAH